MGKVHQFKPKHVGRSRRVSFTQEELRQVFDIYSRRVSTGEWRDYAIGHYDGRAVFSVFRHSSDGAIFAIEKKGGEKKSGRDDQFSLVRGRENLKKSRRLADVLAAVPRGPRLVVSE
ncbi:MAG: DUF2794 domain-containing protein [Alphaproteobacteria bacterium]|nr:DUF2794 domain-containing protein [Alphaproteobacteria bacterium]